MEEGEHTSPDERMLFNVSNIASSTACMHTQKVIVIAFVSW